MFSLEAYRALKAGQGYVRRTDRGVLRVTGRDRAAWLQGLVTNDVLAIPPGGRGYGAYLTPQGRMITDLWVVVLADYLLLDVPSPLAASLRDRLDALIFAEDVQIDDASIDLAVIWTRERTHYVRRTDFSLGGGESLGSPEHPSGSPEIDLDTFDVFRIEAGIPKFLVDMDDQTIPLEAGIEDRAISSTKGCYVGQEVIVRVTTRGQGRVAKKLVGLSLDGPDPPERPYPPIQSGDRDIGRITSAVFSPTLGHAIALGYVHRDFTEPGTGLRAGTARVVVTPLPFVPAATSPGL